MREKLKVHDGDTPGKVIEVKLEYPKPKAATMTDMKCPFCNGELVGTIGHPICRNQNCVMYDDPMPLDLLEELIRTRKALDIAVGALKIIGDPIPSEDCTCYLCAQTALDQITALEQKDVK